MKLSRFIERHGLGMEYEQVDERPLGDLWPKGSRHYDVRLKHGTQEFRLYYTKGPALPVGVDIDEVMECLVSDYWTVESGEVDDLLDPLQASKLITQIERFTDWLGSAEFELEEVEL